MKHIAIVRHGKTENLSPLQLDKERTLLPEGLLEAEFIGKKIAASFGNIDLFLASSAIRSKQTAVTIAKTIGFATESIELMDSLYNQEYRALIKIMRNIDEEHENVIMVGHNPGLSDLITLLNPELCIRLSTCSMCILTFDCHWHDIDENVGRLILMANPEL